MVMLVPEEDKLKNLTLSRFVQTADLPVWPALNAELATDLLEQGEAQPKLLGELC